MVVSPRTLHDVRDSSDDYSVGQRLLLSNCNELHSTIFTTSSDWIDVFAQ